MMTFEDFAGQSAHIERLHVDFASGRNVHAYLLTGPAGTGKRSVARLCAMTAVCRAETKPCGVCGPCRRALSGTHPDIHMVEPPKDKKTIGVEQLRGVIEEVSVKAFEDGAKVMIFPEAEKMTPPAQNCLLKTLEEPPEGTVFFLVTDKPSALLSTIVSRCRTIRFHPLSAADCAKRLVALGESEKTALARARMAEGCVGAALAIDEERLSLRESVTRDFFSVRSHADALGVVNRYKDEKERRGLVLDLMEGACRDILLAMSGAAELSGAMYARQAESYAEKAPMNAALDLMETVRLARKMLASNVAFASCVETILLKISEEYSQWPW